MGHSREVEKMGRIAPDFFERSARSNFFVGRRAFELCTSKCHYALHLPGSKMGDSTNDPNEQPQHIFKGTPTRDWRAGVRELVGQPQLELNVPVPGQHCFLFAAWTLVGIETDLLCSIHCIVVITGEAMTGKSCLMKRWSEKSFSDTYLSTVGVEFGLARMRTMNVPINVQIWDTGA